jgi:hypothetical protein
MTDGGCRDPRRLLCAQGRREQAYRDPLLNPLPPPALGRGPDTCHYYGEEIGDDEALLVRDGEGGWAPRGDQPRHRALGNVNAEARGARHGFWGGTPQRIGGDHFF